MMHFKWKEHKLALGILVILTIANGITFLGSYLDRPSDLKIAKITQSLSEDGFQYQILLRSIQSFPEEAFVQSVDQKGVKQLTRWDLDNRKKWLTINTEKPLEYLAIQTLATVREVDILNNRRFFDAWSPGVKILESISTPEYDYLLDPAGNLWLVAAIRPDSDATMGIYLTILNPVGQKIVDQRLLSQPEVTSDQPLIKRTDQGVLILWTAQELEDKELVATTYVLDSTEVHQIAQSSLQMNGTYLTPLMAEGDPDDSDIFMLGQTEDSLRLSRYTVENARLTSEKTYEFEGTDPLNGSIKQTLMFMDEANNYLLYWLVKNHYDGYLYFSKIAADGKLLIEPRKIYTIPFRVNVPISGVYQEGRLALFYTESFGALSWSTQLAYTVFDGQGEVLQDRELIASSPATHVSVAQDVEGNLNLIWSDQRRGGPRSSYDLFHQQLDHDYHVQIPTSILTDQEADLLAPELRQLGGERYLTWREYQDGKYHLYFKSTHPKFGQQVRRADQSFLGRLIQLITFGFHVFQRQSDKLIYLGFFNFFPLLALLGVVALLLGNLLLANHLINWLLIYQVYFRLELMNIRYFQKFHLFEHLTIHDCDLIAAIIFIVTLAIFAVINYKKTEPRIGKNSLLLLIWVLITGISLAVVNYLQVA